MRRAAVLALLLVSGCSARSASRVALYTGGAGEVISTEVALRRPGVAEANPALQNQAVRIVWRSAAPFLVDLGACALERQGHPRFAFWWRMGYAIGLSLITVHNLQTGR